MELRRRVDALLSHTLQTLAARKRPLATYRLQFHGQFTFQDAAKLVPYLSDLGISHVYASPFLKARPGSTHGYDITDHSQLNPEIGSEEDYAVFQQALGDHGMGLILDTVPNHMGILGNENVWWNDILENGEASQYAEFFDISWDASPRPELRGRLLLPVLGEPYGKVLESGQLQLEYAAGTLVVTYFSHRFPIDVGTYDRVLKVCLVETEGVAGDAAADGVEYQSILTAVKNLPGPQDDDPDRRTERQREKDVIKRRLAQLTDSSDAIQRHVSECIAHFNGQSGDPRSFDRLDALLDEQPYRLAFWRVATDEINYRRFFDVNELAALSMEREEVFAAAHQRILSLLVAGRADGLRIDHPDGLFNPHEYLRRLQCAYVMAQARNIYDTQAVDNGELWNELELPLRKAVKQRLGDVTSDKNSRPLYLIVEKILGSHEALRHDWPVDGTSGYDFVNMLNGLFVDDMQQHAFTKLYTDWIENADSFAEIVYEKKSLILRVSLASELYMLAHRLDRLAQKTRYTRDFTLTTLRHALREIIACFPVYRSYIAEGQVQDADRSHVHTAIRRAKAGSPAISAAIFNFVQDMLLLHYPESATEEDRAEQRRFVGKFEQVTAPVMAKGMEDTAFYAYNRLLPLNEVGGDPSRFGVTPAELHRYQSDRQAQWPLAMSATTTHDTKRSEDVRARLNVLSEMPEQWQAALAQFRQLNQQHGQQVDNASIPDANEEYLLYQTLLGAWPLEPYSAEEFQDFTSRIQQYMVKALHEAKVHSSWINPNQVYDDAMQQFVASILSDHDNNPFITELLPLVRRISHCGMLNSLAQTLLKITSPGVPDIYRGTEVWDFSLVDPDNRRPVNYDARKKLLEDVRPEIPRQDGSRRAWTKPMLAQPQDGRVKLYVTCIALHCRREHPELFASGDYLPLEFTGSRARHVFGFVRRWQNQYAVVMVPRLIHALLGETASLPMGSEIWGDTILHLPFSTAGHTLTDFFSGTQHEMGNEQKSVGITVADILADFPVALLLCRK
ncbi:MAG: malto-oligosyltrehalose synthase [Planctomycetes bacterium]|nr:malto-oligosyltrehalose synthase [Planctomycetota bacterium]